MGLSKITLVLFVTYLKIQLVHNQCSVCCGSCDPYAFYNYGQPDYTQTGYPSTYSQLGCDYQPSHNPHRSEQPTVIVLPDRYDEESLEWMDFLSFVSSLSNGPIFIPYPVPMRFDDYSDNGCLDYVSQNRGCGCSNSENYDWDTGCNCNCGCQNQEQSSNCNSGKRSSTKCSSKKNVIIHKSDRCCKS